jgi:hypothetical protein
VFEGHAEGAFTGTTEGSFDVAIQHKNQNHGREMYCLFKNSTLTLHSHVAVVFRLFVGRSGANLCHFCVLIAPSDQMVILTVGR